MGFQHTQTLGHRQIDNFVVHCVVSMDDSIPQIDGQLQVGYGSDLIGLYPGKAGAGFPQDFRLTLHRRATHFVSRVCNNSQPATNS
jgi:hypothetical protein